jgi:hypothetical protein
MRTIIFLTMFTGGVAFAASEYVEDRALNLDAGGISALQIEAGAGSLEVTGVDGLDQIEVEAIITVPGRNDDKARNKIESDLELTLEERGGKAILRSIFEDGIWDFGDSPSVQLIVRMPAQLDLNVDDGSGSLVVENVHGDIELVDGSGSISMSDVGGSVDVDDGSGSIDIRGVGGDISISDGSGSITVRDVAGSVVVDDGSGSINVADIEADLIIVSDGSGGLNFSNIGGRVDGDMR